MTGCIDISPAISDLVQYEWTRRDPECGFMVTTRIIGIKTSQKQHIYKWLHDTNKFSADISRIPDQYKKVHLPRKSFILEHVSNPNKHRVIREDMPKTANTKIYHTHDNGGRPFVVYVDDCVRVYKIPDDAYAWREDWSDNPEDNVNLYTKLIYETEYNKVFVGKHVDDNPETIGNSILVDTCDNNYTFIGDKIYKFHTDEIITNYYSLIGNSNVPYPVAVSQNYIYFMLDCVWVKKSALNVPELDMINAYTYFYDHYSRADKEYDENVIRMNEIVIIERQW